MTISPKPPVDPYRTAWDPRSIVRRRLAKLRAWRGRVQLRAITTAVLVMLALGVGAVISQMVTADGEPRLTATEWSRLWSRSAPYCWATTLDTRSYTNANITVDALGRITAASSGTTTLDLNSAAVVTSPSKGRGFMLDTSQQTMIGSPGGVQVGGRVIRP